MNGITEQDTIKRDDTADPRTWGRTDATMSYKPYIYDVSLPELTRWVETNNYEPYRVRQIRSWLWKGVSDSAELTNLPENMRDQLGEDFDFNGLELVQRLPSKIDSTTKYVSQLADGNLIETVYMKYRQGTSVCVSTQVGCKMGCEFCASSKEGFGRNLTTGEMLAQVALVARDQDRRIDHLVLMGMGEPFDNYENVLRFIKTANDPKGFNIGMRRMTISTCGLVPEINRFASEQLQVTLAISLHASNDEVRQKIMPIAKRYDLQSLMRACRDYTNKTKRRITFEYNLIAGVNDKDEHAAELISLLRGMLAHVNLIPMNEVEESEYKRSSPERVRRFRDILEDGGLNVTIRRELGTDIEAACGQLRRRFQA